MIENANDMKLLTKNVFLDTNIFEENNFFQSTAIQSLFHYGRIKVINLYMSEVSRLEVIDRMKKRLQEVVLGHNEFVRLVNKKYRVLKNLNQYRNLERSPIDLDRSLAELELKLKRIIEASNIQFIDSNVNVVDVFRLYFKEAAPFSGKNKKHEFPDAFIIKSIEKWCDEQSQEMIFVTKDLDFKEYRSPAITFHNDFGGLLEEITFYFDSMQKETIIPSVKRALEKNKTVLLKLIDNEIDSMIGLDFDFETVANYERGEIAFDDYKIISLRADYAEVTYMVEISFSYTKIPSISALEDSFFDDALKAERVIKKVKVPCDIEVNIRNTEIIRLKWINFNQKIILSDRS